ncbi:uncharacterized protein WCC33_009916 [Rhinophrynus dorsalis]
MCLPDFGAFKHDNIQCREHQKKQIVQYLETFKISSRSEAYTFLNLTQTLSEALKEYHVQSKGHNVLELGESLGMSTGSSEPMSDHIKQNKDRDGEENDVESAGICSSICIT